MTNIYFFNDFFSAEKSNNCAKDAVSVGLAVEAKGDDMEEFKLDTDGTDKSSLDHLGLANYDGVVVNSGEFVKIDFEGPVTITHLLVQGNHDDNIINNNNVICLLEPDNFFLSRNVSV